MKSQALRGMEETLSLFSAARCLCFGANNIRSVHWLRYFKVYIVWNGKYVLIIFSKVYLLVFSHYQTAVCNIVYIFFNVKEPFLFCLLLAMC